LKSLVHRKTRFIEKSRTFTDADESKIGYGEEISDLCYLLFREKARLCMRAERGALSHPIWKRRKLEIADAPSVSLRNALSDYKLSRTSRLSLSIIIANSVRQFYTSKWMLRPWTKDDLYFLREADHCEDDMQIYAHKPHLATVFEPADPN